MTEEQKKKIADAISGLILRAIAYGENRTDEKAVEMCKAENAVYDAIGGMDFFKYSLVDPDDAETN